MPEIKKKMSLLGHEADVTEVPVSKSNEPWSEYELEDGSVLKCKNIATSVLRIEGQYNPGNGFPMYLVLFSPNVVVVSAPEDLRKKV
jgi:hypothetical protein